MTVANWTEADSRRAQEIWSEYQQQHEVSKKAGQTAGIDPVGGCIWFGDSIQNVVARRDAAGSAAPLFFVRVGFATYYRKEGHRCVEGLQLEPPLSIAEMEELRKVQTGKTLNEILGRLGLP